MEAQRQKAVRHLAPSTEYALTDVMLLIRKKVADETECNSIIVSSRKYTY